MERATKHPESSVIITNNYEEAVTHVAAAAAAAEVEQPSSSDDIIVHVHHDVHVVVEVIEPPVVRLVEQEHHEVEPEVDIEVVDIIRHNNINNSGDGVSMLTTSAAAIAIHNNNREPVLSGARIAAAEGVCQDEDETTAQTALVAAEDGVVEYHVREEDFSLATTILATDVEEVEDDRNNNNPGPGVRLVEQEELYCHEVEPEIGIEEVDIIRHSSNRDGISALTTATSATALHEKEETKPPPVIPNNRAEAFGATRNTNMAHTIALNNGDTPDFKAQCNSRSLVTVVASVAAIAQEDGDTIFSSAVAAEAIAQDHHHHHPAAAADPVPNEYLPDSKYQTLPMTSSSSPPAGSPISSRQVSNNSSNHTSSDNEQQQGHIPVVDAVLVPAERLEAEDRQRSAEQGQENGQGSGHGSSLTASSNSNNSEAKSGVVPPPRSERSFWVTVIISAMLLNSLLVTGIVVGGFCAAGKCSSSSSTLKQGAPIPDNNDDTVVVLSPSLAPASRNLSARPTLVASNNPFYRGTLPPGLSEIPVSPTSSEAAPTGSPLDDPSGTSTSAVPPSQPGIAASPTSSEAAPTASPLYGPPTFGSSVPTPTLSKVSEPNVETLSSPPSETVLGIGSDPEGWPNVKEDEEGVSWWILGPLALLLEGIISFCLFLYYRCWKRQRQEYLEGVSVAPATERSKATTEP